MLYISLFLFYFIISICESLVVLGTTTFDGFSFTLENKNVISNVFEKGKTYLIAVQLLRK